MSLGLTSTFPNPLENLINVGLSGQNKAIFLCSETDDIWKGTILTPQHVMLRSAFCHAPEQGSSFF